jgi:hypothetical protein
MTGGQIAVVRLRHRRIANRFRPQSPFRSLFGRVPRGAAPTKLSGFAALPVGMEKYASRVPISEKRLANRGSAFPVASGADVFIDRSPVVKVKVVGCYRGCDHQLPVHESHWIRPCSPTRASARMSSRAPARYGFPALKYAASATNGA